MLAWNAIEKGVVWQNTLNYSNSLFTPTKRNHPGYALQTICGGIPLLTNGLLAEKHSDVESFLLAWPYQVVTCPVKWGIKLNLLSQS